MSDWLARSASRSSARGGLWAGFAVVIALLVFSTIRAYQIQSTLSEEALDVYHHHIQEDELVLRLRRTLWLGASSSRDYLLDPDPDRAVKYSARLRELKTESLRRLDELERLPMPGRDESDLRGIRAAVNEFWSALENVPAATERLGAEERYNFLQDEIVPRRSSASEGIREFAQMTQRAFQENEAMFARSRRAGAQRLLALLGLSLLLALLVAILTLARTARLESQSERQYQEAARAKADLRLLSARLMQVQEEERTRLSRELHDEIGQTLATLRLEIRRAEALPARKLAEIRVRLMNACELAERTIQTVRDTCRLLRPALLDDLGLSPALQWLVDDFSRRTGVPCEFVESGFHDVLPDLARTCVFRVVQEALHNCEKHAGATEVSVRIEQSPGLLTVSIEDNGGGFKVDPADASLPARHSGILGMRERALALGGTLEIDSSVGAGTRVSLRLPLDEASPATSAVALRPMEDHT